MERDNTTRPVVTTEEIARDLRALGLGDGDTVLVHSAMSRIGFVEGGAPAVAAGFRQALGRGGTLAVPTFPFHGTMRAYCESDPLFIVEETPSLMGAFSEAVRTHPEALRSGEPSHPVAAIGPRAEFLLSDHVNARGSCDEHSPLYRLTLCGGYVLMLGVDFRNCTLLHCAEELARVPFIDYETCYPMRCRDHGRAYTMAIYCHSAPVPANFGAIEPALRDRGLLTVGRVGTAECRLARAKDILDVALAGLARDPFCLRVRPEKAGATG